MGLFDYITVEMELPELPEEDRGVRFQTKDTPNQGLDNYFITKEGRLQEELVEREWVDDEDAIFKGYFREVPGTRRRVFLDFTGSVVFYTSNVCAAGPHGYATHDGKPERDHEYQALFQRGKVIALDRIRRQSGLRDRGLPHLSREEWEKIHHREGGK